MLELSNWQERPWIKNKTPLVPSFLNSFFFFNYFDNLIIFKNLSTQSITLWWIWSSQTGSRNNCLLIKENQTFPPNQSKPPFQKWVTFCVPERQLSPLQVPSQATKTGTCRPLRSNIISLRARGYKHRGLLCCELAYLNFFSTTSLSG